MLFISRRVGLHYCGVVDTDDGVEEVAFVHKVKEAVALRQIEVKGIDTLVELGDGVKFDPFKHTILSRLYPYQPVETMSRLQTKMNILKHVEVTTYGDMITNIFWDSKHITEPVVVRLRDFGSHVADCVLFDNPCTVGHKITIVFDDGIKLEHFSFRRPEQWATLGVAPDGLGMKFDLRNIKDFAYAKSVHDHLVNQDGQANAFKYIIDHSERMKKIWRC